MTETDLWAARNRLRDAVALLASPAEAQEEWLRTIGTYPLADELAIEFDDWARLLPQFERDGLVDEASARAVQELDDILERLQSKLGERHEKWDASRLRNSEAWRKVRRAAGHALVAFVIHDSRAVPAASAG